MQPCTAGTVGRRSAAGAGPSGTRDQYQWEERRPVVKVAGDRWVAARRRGRVGHGCSGDSPG